MRKNKTPIIVSAVLLGIAIIVFSSVIIYLHTANSDKTLIVYFSRVGNTDFSNDVDAVSSASLRRNMSGELIGNCEVMANTLQKATGADVFAVTVQDKYPESYDETVSRASEEQSSDTRPALTSSVENMDKYKKIILIYPVWWSTIPQPMFTFLESYDFSDKEIYPVATHKGSFLGSGVKDIEELCPNADVHAGVPIAGGSVDRIRIIPIAVIASLALILTGSCVRYKAEVKTKASYAGGAIVIVGVLSVIGCIIRVMI